MDVQEYGFPRSNVRVIVTDQAEEILASKGVSLAEEKCMQARFVGLSRTLGTHIEVLLGSILCNLSFKESNPCSILKQNDLIADVRPMSLDK